MAQTIINHGPRILSLFIWCTNLVRGIGPCAAQASKTSCSKPVLKYDIGGFEVCEKAWCILMGVNEKRDPLAELPE